MSYVKIPAELLQKYGQDESGKIAFVCHVLHTAIEMANYELDEQNMEDYHYYRENKGRYPDEFKYAKHILEEQIREVMKNITNDIIEGVFQEE